MAATKLPKTVTKLKQEAEEVDVDNVFQMLRATLRILTQAVSDKPSFYAFVLNPKHVCFIVLFIISAFGTLRVGLQELVFAESTSTDIAMFCTFCLWFGTMTSLFQVSIQEMIDRFRSLNKRFVKANEDLAKQVDELVATSDKMGACLQEYSDIRTKMEEFATAQGVTFDKAFDEVTGVFDNISKAQTEQEQVILMKAYTDLEFFDGQEGMSEKEWKRFCAVKAPKKYRPKWESPEERERISTSLAGSDGLIHAEAFKTFVDALITEFANNNNNNNQQEGA